MLSSARGAGEPRRAAADAEVSAAAAAATGSEAVRPGDRDSGDQGGRAPAATSSTGWAEGAEHLEDSPAPKPDPEPGRMDHHQLGTGRYQVVSSWPPPPPPPGLRRRRCSGDCLPPRPPECPPSGYSRRGRAGFSPFLSWPDLLLSRLSWSLSLPALETLPSRLGSLRSSPPRAPTLCAAVNIPSI